jgi:acyl carrier protein
MEFNQDELIQIIAENMDLPVATVKPRSSFREDLGADSLDLVELAISVEDKYGIDIPDADLKKFVKVQDAIDYLKGVEK